MLFIGVLLAGALVSGCDSKPAAPPAGGAARQVTVVGNGKVDGAPDTLTANATVTFTGSDVTVAMNQTNERQQAVVEALVTAGVDRKDIATSNVTLHEDFNAFAGFTAEDVRRLRPDGFCGLEHGGGREREDVDVSDGGLARIIHRQASRNCNHGLFKRLHPAAVARESAKAVGRFEEKRPAY